MNRKERREQIKKFNKERFFNYDKNNQLIEGAFGKPTPIRMNWKMARKIHPKENEENTRKMIEENEKVEAELNKKKTGLYRSMVAEQTTNKYSPFFQKKNKTKA